MTLMTLNSVQIYPKLTVAYPETCRTYNLPETCSSPAGTYNLPGNCSSPAGTYNLPGTVAYPQGLITFPETVCIKLFVRTALSAMRNFYKTFKTLIETKKKTVSSVPTGFPAVFFYSDVENIA